MPPRARKIALLLLLAAAVVAFFFLDLHRHLRLDALKANLLALRDLYAGQPLVTLGGYFLLYVLVTALSLPGAAVMTVAGAAIFGFWPALVVVSFASSLGATLAFLLSRFLLRDWVQARFGERLRAINAGVAKDGAFYLFTLRLVPVFPFFLINLALGLTPLRTRTFYWVSQLGMLPGTAVFVNAGIELGRLDSLAGILSPRLLLAFALLGLFPLLARNFTLWLQARRALAGFRRPRRFDYNLVVLGAGSAGLVAAYTAAAARAKVALVEKDRMGGDCLHTGCVPSKALLRSARLAALSRRSGEFGIATGNLAVDFAAVMARVRQVIGRIEPHDSAERYAALGVDCIRGEGRITSPWTVQVGERTLTARAIVVATGATPFVPPLPGLDGVDYLTSANLWQLQELPPRLVVLGGGPIGCEMAFAFARLGSAVTLVEAGERLLGREDADVSDLVSARLAAEGVQIRTGCAAVEVRGAGRRLLCTQAGQPVEFPFDRLLVAVGRRATTAGFGLEDLGLRLDPQGRLASDPFLRTSVPTIFCAGDVTAPFQFTHTAAHQAWHAAMNALFGGVKAFRVDYRVVPRCTFTDPEVAAVGLNEAEAQAGKIPYEVTRFELADLDRALAEGETAGWVKVLTAPGSDRILGATIVGARAGDLLAEFTLAMRHRLGLKKILQTIHPYPTFAEGNRMAAGRWQQEHLPPRLLAWAARFHAWRRR